MKDMKKYLDGDALYGDDLNIQEIEKWFTDEKEAYADLGAKDKSNYEYAYHQLNIELGYSKLRNEKYKNVLGFGSAYGDELYPILDRAENITIIDPSDSFTHKDIKGVKCSYIKPNMSGDLAFKDEEFDLIVCLGVLHHIPNVTHVLHELYRCLSIDGEMLLREPIVSMGDWTKDRPGLTKHERGIPLKIFDSIIRNCGFNFVAKSYCVFPLIPKLANVINTKAYNSKALTLTDVFLSKLFAWNIRYHTRTFLHKFRPASVYFYLRK